MTGEAQSSPAIHRLPAAIAALLLLAAPAARAQQRSTRAATPPPSPATAAPASGAERVEATHRVELHLGPDSSTVIGTLEDSASARVTARRGDWVRVQVEAWVRADDVRTTTGPLRGVTAAELHADPERYVGRTVEWKLQLIGVQVADELRPELPAGQPYLLMRGPLPEPGFVYVSVPRAQVARFRALPSLAELVLHVTITAPRTRFLATPVAELVEAVSGL